MSASAPTIPDDDEQGCDRRYRRLVDAHFSGRVSPAGEREMRAHLVVCGPCRAYYDRHLLLGRLVPDGAPPMRDRLAGGLGLSAARSEAGARAVGQWRILAAAGAIAAAFLLVRVGPHRPFELEPRGAVPGSQLLAYELTPGGTPRPVGTYVHTEAGLAFAYANIGRRRYLMVFAVDETRRVYWYHPAWQSRADDPIGLEIAGDDAVHEIPQAITHHFAGRRLQLFGVFLDRAMSVRDIEDLVAHAPADNQRQLQLRIPGADVTQLDLKLVAAP